MLWKLKFNMKRRSNELIRLKNFPFWVGFSGISLLLIIYHKEMGGIKLFEGCLPQGESSWAKAIGRNAMVTLKDFEQRRIAQLAEMIFVYRPQRFFSAVFWKHDWSENNWNQTSCRYCNSAAQRKGSNYLTSKIITLGKFLSA